MVFWGPIFWCKDEFILTAVGGQLVDGDVFLDVLYREPDHFEIVGVHLVRALQDGRGLDLAPLQQR